LGVRPSFLVLDDALSSVDTETEAAIQARLAAHNGRTTVLIAHRISTVRHADLIIVIDDGRLIDSGTHEVLMRRGGFYAELFRMQQREGIRRSDASKDGMGPSGGV
jgi:ATP-binding cassette subfamily B protein